MSKTKDNNKQKENKKNLFNQLKKVVMKSRILFLAILVSIFVVSCNDDDDISFSKGEMSFELPKSASEATVKSLNVTITNVNTGEVITKETTSTSLSDLNLEDGIYNISVVGEITYPTSYVENSTDADGNAVTSTITKDVTSKVRGAKQNVEIKGGSFNTSLLLYLQSASTGFVISEVFFADTKTPEGKQYGNGDQYIELYNNSDKVLYADGYCIAETELMTTMLLNEYTPDVRNSEVPVSSVYMIPGSGTDYPVQPGETFLITDVAINHKGANSNSFDLSKADAEWFDGTDIDVDVPEVPNLIKLVSTSRSVWHLHNRGYKGYVLFKTEQTLTAEQFSENNAYDYKYHFVFGTFERWMDFEAWKVPNTWVVDAVQCSAPSKFEWTVMSPELDLSWTHSGDADDARYGHSVKRKVSYTEDGRVVLQDTNDSTNDFIATAEPSPGTIEAE